MNEKYFIGIDPGSTGSLFCLKDDNTFFHIRFKDCDFKLLATHFINILSYVSDGVAYICLEQVHSMPGQGVSSTFTFGENYGFIQGILYSHFHFPCFVSPKKWKKYYIDKYNITYDTDSTKIQKKALFKPVAQSLIPNLKLTNDLVDSFLIANYCKIHHEEMFKS